VHGVKSSRALKWLVLAVLLSLTLGWKLVARSTVGEQPTERDVQVAVAEFLVRQHFSVSISERVEEGKPAIGANSGSCRMLVAKSPALGWDRDLIRRYAEAEDRIFVVFRGRIYSDQPTFLTVFDALSSRFWRELGFKVSPKPVLAVVARINCDAERLSWDQLDFARH
jgi:hypothetical protein